MIMYADSKGHSQTVDVEADHTSIPSMSHCKQYLNFKESKQHISI